MVTKSVACTLFEGHYHYGVAALINSLYNYGFKGDFYVGYRGPLPWAIDILEVSDNNGRSYTTLKVTDDLLVHFIPVETDKHLTNYKPTFMLSPLNGLAKQSKGIFYFDPDIVNKCDWSYYEQWIGYGVAMVQEIVASNVSPFHPKRMAWNAVIEKSGLKVERNLYNYFNGGFLGVKQSDKDFLMVFENIIEIGIRDFGFDSNHFSKKSIQTTLFPAGDQDALNIAAMCCKNNISDFGPEGMDFLDGGWLMSHATGSPKPWKKSFLGEAMHGKRVKQCDRIYWLSQNLPIKTHPSFIIATKKVSIKMASFVNRFYSK